MKLINCMKHGADLLQPNGEVLRLEPSGHVANVNTKTVSGEPFAGFPTVKTEMGELEGLPEPEQGVVYYVNMLVFNAAVSAGRKDVVMGDSGQTAVRWTAEDAEAGRCNPKLVGLVRYITHLILP
jgi:hypothetical protein